MKRSARLVLAATVLLLLAGCGGGGDDDTQDVAPGFTETPGQPDPTDGASPGTAPTANDGGAVDDGATNDGATDGAPSDDTTAGTALRGCEDLPEASDGEYTVADAGSLTMTRDGEVLTLVEVRPGDGWTYTEDDRDDTDEVEVTFRNNGREIEFEAEVDDGRLEIEVCEDD